jgi:hypothetical protein
LTASQKVHLRRCASSFVIAAYVYVRLIPQDSRALHLELFTGPSTLATFYQVVNLSVLAEPSLKGIAQAPILLAGTADLRGG